MENKPFTELPLRKKLSTKLFVVTTIWWLSALLAIFFTLSLLLQLEGAGAAINDAGSLRMRSYRLVLLDQSPDKTAVRREAAEFSEVLGRIVEGDSKRPLMLPKDEAIVTQAASLLQMWNEQILPDIIDGESDYFKFEVANTFVQAIDKLVQMIEKRNDATLSRLHFYQYFLIALVVAGSIVMLYILLRLIIRPLQNLNYIFSHAHTENFTYQEPLNTRDDEFGLLSIGYSQMATRLEAVYRGMEKTIEEKTYDLQQRNSELESLYTITASLHDHHDLQTVCHDFLIQVMPIINADAGAIRLQDYNEQKMKLIAEINMSLELSQSQKCEHFDDCYCGKFAQTESPAEEVVIQNLLQSEPPCLVGTYEALHIFPIFYDKEKIGIMTLFSYDSQRLSVAKKNLLDSLSNQLGMAIGGIRLMERTRRIAVLEERNQLAQGLHDSIAQTLNFLNLQVQMLEKAFKADQKAQAGENLAFIKDGIRESYDNVRQLLINFRTPLRLESFSYHLEEMIKRFREQTGIEVKAMVDMSDIHLSDKEKLEVVLIIQEALSNIRKHAKATEVSLQIYSDGNQSMIKVTDNGQGFEATILREKSLNHVGLLIMEERAQKIGAQLSFNSQPGNGVELCLTIPHKLLPEEHKQTII